MASFGCILHLWPKQFGEATEILQLDPTLSHYLEWKASHGAFSRKGSLQSFVLFHLGTPQRAVGSYTKSTLTSSQIPKSPRT